MNATATKTRPVSTPKAPANVPVSPVVSPAGKSVKGPHIQAWRACDKFAHDASIEMVAGSGNLWKENTPGDRFYKLVLAKNPKTVGEAVSLAGKLNPAMRESEVQGHLRWIYTASGAYIRIGGKAFPADPHAKAPKAK